MTAQFFQPTMSDQCSQEFVIGHVAAREVMSRNRVGLRIEPDHRCEGARHVFPPVAWNSSSGVRGRASRRTDATGGRTPLSLLSLRASACRRDPVVFT